MTHRYYHLLHRIRTIIAICLKYKRLQRGSSSGGILVFIDPGTPRGLTLRRMTYELLVHYPMILRMQELNFDRRGFRVVAHVPLNHRTKQIVRRTSRLETTKKQQQRVTVAHSHMCVIIQRSISALVHHC